MTGLGDEWVAVDDGTFISTIGNVFQRRNGGLWEIALPTEPRHQNLSGAVHGGIYMALMDRVLGVNIREASPARRMATVSLTVHFQRSTRPGDLLIATCEITRLGRKSGFGDARVCVGDRIVATGTGVFMSVDAPAPAS